MVSCIWKIGMKMTCFSILLPCEIKANSLLGRGKKQTHKPTNRTNLLLALSQEKTRVADMEERIETEIACHGEEPDTSPFQVKFSG